MGKRPEQWKILKAAFDRERNSGLAYKFLADGIEACLENASFLLAEFLCLASNGFNARAQFVYATAMEELGKVLILFDFARVSWQREEWVTLLCKAFYHHLKKAAYAKVIYWPGSGALADALYLYKLGLIEHFPNNDPESGEPDEYAGGIVDREWGLYVDWSEFDGRWFLPTHSTLAYYYAQEKWDEHQRVGEQRIASVLSELTAGQREGLFTDGALRVVHTVMSQLYVTASTPEADVIRILQDVRAQLSAIGINISEGVIKSKFMDYPLYAVILTPEQVKGYWE
jgi:AbiV family abortive infection protein